MSQPDPPGRSRRPRFRETALASGLLEEAQIAAVEREIEATAPGATADAEARDKTVADALVARGLLTSFQAREMLAGRRRFRLGQYTVLDEVGKGGMGRVFRAEHAMMGREVAVKVLPREKSTPESEAAFRREMRMLGRLDHENLVRAFDAGFDAQVYYLVTELVPGVDLKRYVRERGPLDETSAAVVIAQAARGLAYAHEQGLVHRDVKPGNILVLRDMRVKVLDLGLAESNVEEESSRVGRIIGTMDYIAPEQISEPDGAGPVVDVYSLGCTLYFAVTGQVPFPGGSRREKLQKHLHERPQPVKELAPHLSAAFCRVIEDMMAKSPTERIGSAGEVIERLQPWLAEGRRRPRVTDPQAAASLLPGDGEAIVSLTLPSDESSSFWDNLVPPTPGSSRSLLADMLPARAATRRLLQSVGWALLFAAGVGLAFGIAMAVLRRVDAPRFHDLVFGMSPPLLGCLAFLLIFVLQMLVALGGRR